METLIYTVQKGDTVYDIAKRCGSTVGIIARYNGLIEPDKIYPGQLLRIPVSQIPEIQKKCCTSGMDYIVKAGDTLADIALRYHVGFQRLAETNKLDDPDRIRAGQVLRIPMPQMDEYVVQKGDTLNAIARKSQTDAEAPAQKSNLPDPDVLYAGQGLSVAERASGDRQPDSEGKLIYTVQSGDTLWKIARKYGVSVPYLINLNRLTAPDCLREGQVLTIRK